MNTTSEKIEQIQAQKTQRNRFLAIIAILAAMVIAAVALWLHATGVAVTSDALCGQQEHSHSDACYEQVLVCEDTVDSHKHDDSCYEEELACMLDEHVHNEKCYTSNESKDKNAISASSSKDVVSAAAKNPSDGDGKKGSSKEDIAATDGRIELDKYLSDVNLKGKWGTDLASVASALKGYKAPEDVYEIASQISKQGFSEFDSWNEAFVAFCLAYSDISDKYIPRASDVREWVADLQKSGMYEPSDGYTPQIGDLVFIDTVGNNKADSVGIATMVNTDLGQLKVVSGEADGDTVQSSYDFAKASKLVGYCPISEVQARVDDPDAAKTPEDGNGTDTPSSKEPDKGASDVFGTANTNEGANTPTEGEFETFINESGMKYQILDNGEWIDIKGFEGDIDTSSKLRLVAPFHIGPNSFVGGATTYNWRILTKESPIKSVDEASGSLEGTQNAVFANYSISKAGVAKFEFTKEFIEMNTSSDDDMGLSYEGVINASFDASDIEVAEDGSATLPLGQNGQFVIIKKAETSVPDNETYAVEPLDSGGDHDQNASSLIYANGQSANVSVKGIWVDESGNGANPSDDAAVKFKVMRTEYPLDMGLMQGGKVSSEVSLSINIDMVKGASDTRCQLPSVLSDSTLVKPGTILRMVADCAKSDKKPEIKVNGKVVGIAAEIETDNQDHVIYTFQPIAINGNSTVEGFIFADSNSAKDTDAAKVLAASAIELADDESTTSGVTGNIEPLGDAAEVHLDGYDLVLNKGNNWQMTISDLPASGPYSKDANTTVYYQYSIKELPSAQYTLVDTNVISDGNAVSVELTNIGNTNEVYSLPKTGNDTLKPFMILVALVALIPISMLITGNAARNKRVKAQ